MATTTHGQRNRTGNLVPRLGPEAVGFGVFARFRRVVEAQPDAVAVVDARRAVSFRDLATEAAGVLAAISAAISAAASAASSAAASAASSAAPDGDRRPVAMLCGHDAAAVATVLGALASGRPLLVLDPRTPGPRLRSFAERVGVGLVLCDLATESAAAGLGLPTLVLGAHGVPAGDPGDLWSDQPRIDRPALLSFTSGSTGVPKVVEFAERQIVGDAWANSTAGDCYDETDVVAHTLPMAFSAGLYVTTAVPLVGGTLVMYDVRAEGLAGLPGWLDRHSVTVMHASPAILRAFVASAPDPMLLRGLRSLTVAGETVHGRDVEAARRVFGRGVTVFNRYGSSEAGLISEFVLRPGEPTPDGPLPAGCPVGRTRISLLGEDGLPVPPGRPGAPGRPGTVVVHREHLSIGYLGDECATAAAFGRDDDDLRTFYSSDLGHLDEQGRLVLLGRRDHSVKIRGYLVEPGEIDAVLFALPSVREAVTVGLTGPDGQVRLVAYVVAAEAQLNAATVRAALRESLPAHMVPATVVFMDALPRTERGKLDRAALPEPVTVVASSAGQQLNDWEQVVADEFARALSLDDIGLDDDFFELGGDSLTAQAVMAAMTGELGVTGSEATTALLIQAPTVRQLAARLDRTPEAGGDVLIPVQTGGSRPPLFVMAGGGGLGVAFLHLARHLGPEQPLYALQARGLERRARPDRSVEAAARRNLREIRRVQPEGPYHLAGHSFGGLVALEMAHRLRAAGQEVAILIELDSFAPDPSLHARGGRLSLRRIKEGFGLLLTGIRGDRYEQFWRFYRLSEQLHRRYRGKPYDGKVLLVLAESEQRSLASRWDAYLTGDRSTVEVPGDHLSMLRQPFVAVTAEALRTALDRLP